MAEGIGGGMKIHANLELFAMRIGGRDRGALVSQRIDQDSTVADVAMFAQRVEIARRSADVFLVVWCGLGKIAPTPIGGGENSQRQPDAQADAVRKTMVGVGKRFGQDRGAGAGKLGELDRTQSEAQPGGEIIRTMNKILETARRAKRPEADDRLGGMDGKKEEAAAAPSDAEGAGRATGKRWGREESEQAYPEAR